MIKLAHTYVHNICFQCISELIFMWGFGRWCSEEWWSWQSSTVKRNSTKEFWDVLIIQKHYLYLRYLGIDAHFFISLNISRVFLLQSRAYIWYMNWLRTDILGGFNFIFKTLCTPPTTFISTSIILNEDTSLSIPLHTTTTFQTGFPNSMALTVIAGTQSEWVNA